MNYQVVRHTKLPADLAILDAALKRYVETYRHLPPEIVVHTTKVEEVRGLVKTRAPVRGCGGCLVGELWLALPDEDKA